MLLPHGDIYYKGYGVNRCFRSVASIYEEGVARHDTKLKFMLSECYEFDNGVETNGKYAVHLYTEAIAEGCEDSMASMGALKVRSSLARSNHMEAVHLLRKAVSMGV